MKQSMETQDMSTQSTKSELSQNNKYSFKNVTKNVAEEIIGTPFSTINTSNGTRLIMGNAIISEVLYESREQAIKDIQEINWNVLCNVIITLIMKMEEMNKLKENENNA